ncbi:radical SAM protein [Rubrivivax gelatinosus]|nr:radical SAM protein [Rubrivivax gelatinosus]
MNLALPHSSPTAPPLPRFAQIEPVGHCNLACRMCTVKHRGDAVTELPFERFLAWLDEMPQLEHLHLQGLGEPMLHPRFFDMVQAAAARGIRVGANTNLTLLTPERARRCVDGALAELSVSLDGASAAVYEAVRQGASFAKVLRNLDRLMAACAAQPGRLAVRGVMVLMRSNVHELPALVRLLHAHGVGELLVQRLSSDLEHTGLPTRYIPIRDYVRDAELAPAELPRAAEVFAEATQVAGELGLVLHLPRLAPPQAAAAGVRGCSWPTEQLYLTAAGHMLPCCMVASADRADFGRVADTPGGLAATWSGELAQSFRAALAGPVPPAVCRSCALYEGRF